MLFKRICDAEAAFGSTMCAEFMANHCNMLYGVVNRTLAAINKYETETGKEAPDYMQMCLDKADIAYYDAINAYNNAFQSWLSSNGHEVESWYSESFDHP